MNNIEIAKRIEEITYEMKDLYENHRESSLLRRVDLTAEREALYKRLTPAEKKAKEETGNYLAGLFGGVGIVAPPDREERQQEFEQQELAKNQAERDYQSRIYAYMNECGSFDLAKQKVDMEMYQAQIQEQQNQKPVKEKSIGSQIGSALVANPKRLNSRVGLY